MREKAADEASEREDTKRGRGASEATAGNGDKL